MNGAGATEPPPPPPRMHALVIALQFLTRLPLPCYLDSRPPDLARAAPWFPAVGLIVGGLCASAAAVLLSVTPLAPGVIAIATVALGVLITGAFHEDGLADAADGLIGGMTRADRLRIMRDSRVGSFGALALTLLILGRVGCLWATHVAVWPIALIVAHILGRWAALLLIATQRYARDDAPGVGKPIAFGLSTAGLWLTTLWTLATVIIVGGIAGAIGVALAIITSIACAAYCWRRIGGITGDCLGAANVLCELVTLMIFSAIHPALTSPWVSP